MSNKNEIEIWVSQEREQSRAAMPRMAQASRKAVTTSAEVLSNNLQAFIKAFGGALSTSELDVGEFVLDELELNLVVNSRGGIELVGKLETGVSASFKVTLKRRNTDGTRA